MKRTRASSLKDEFERVVAAEEIPPEDSKNHIYRCFNEACGAIFHYVSGHRRLENTKEVRPFFARNRSSNHATGCAYDYERIVRENRGVASYSNGEFQLRLNFPLGGSPRDRNPGWRGLNRQQREAVEAGHKGVRSINSLGALVNFLEKECGGLDSPALDNLTLFYQGEHYEWNAVFTGMDYHSLVKAAREKTAESSSPWRLAVVVPEREWSLNLQGKKRYACRDIKCGDGQSIRPIITCANDSIASQVKINEPLLVAVRPYVSNSPNQVFLYVAEERQITPTKNDYVKSSPREQLTLFSPPPQTTDSGPCGCIPPRR